MQTQTASTSTFSALFLAKIPTFTHQDKKICFTGKFFYGTREMCQSIAEEKGATISTSVTLDLDILIIGKLGSPHWKYFNYGRKIEKAILYNNRGKKILLLPENEWVEAL